MKYIRTKDGRLFVVKNSYNFYYEGFEGEHTYFETLKGHCFVDDQVLKQADTIKELCDEYILKRSDESKPRVLNKDNIDYYKNFNKEGGPEHSYSIELFAAIWVRDINGNILLKPVARLNDKGEL